MQERLCEVRMLPELTNCVLDSWNSFFPGVDKPQNLCYLGISGSVEGGTTTVLGFNNRDSRPLFAVKIHRNYDACERAFNERDVLNYVGTCGGATAASVPRIILCERIAGTWVLVQSILDGSPMSAVMSNDRTPHIEVAAHNMHLAADWLLQLHEATRNDLEIDQAHLIQNGLKTIEDFSNIFDLLPDEYDFLKEVSDRLCATVSGNGCVQHGDFCRQNVLISKNADRTKIGVLDWTDAKLAGFPLHDLLYFLTTYCLQIRKELGITGFVNIFEDSFFKRNAYSNLIKQCITSYCAQLRLDLSFVKILFGMFLIEQAMFEYNKLVKFSTYGGLPRFHIYLASSNNRSYDEALKEQLWIYFFRVLTREQHNFII